MNELAIYDLHQPGPIMPVVQIKKNLSVFTGGAWSHFLIDYIEPMPLGSQSVFDMLQQAPTATSLAANGTMNKKVVPQLRANLNEILHLRWKPLDTLEGILWEQPNKSRFESRALASRVDWRTQEFDPYLSTTTFVNLGVTQGDRDFALEVRNPTGWVYPQVRFMFWGIRYIGKPITIPPGNNSKGQSVAALMAAGDMDTIKQVMGASTFVVAEGRGS